jgi:putative endonuclease
LNFLDRLLSFFKRGSSAAHIIRGKKGEELAGRFLEKKGFAILARNFRVKGGEADLIAAFQNRTVVVEVKTRSNRNFGPPQSAVDKRKIKRLVLAGTVYCRTNSLPQSSLRVDVIAIEIRDGKPSIRHIENVNY